MWAGEQQGLARSDRVAQLELVRADVQTAATLAHERTLPLVEGLHELIPSAMLQRGSTLAVHGAGATSFSLAVVAEAVRAGSFLAIVAPSTFNLAACLDFGIPLRRVVQFDLPGGRGQTSGGQAGGADQAGRTAWPQLVAAIIEGFDLVVLADRRRASASQARRLVARTRERGSVVVRAGGPSWADAPDLRFDVQAPEWQGLGRGHGHLVSRAVTVQVGGRRWPGRPQVRHLRLSARGVEPIEAPRLLVPQSGVARDGAARDGAARDGAARDGAGEPAEHVVAICR